jgi:hypothetical protein
MKPEIKIYLCEVGGSSKNKTGGQYGFFLHSSTL